MFAGTVAASIARALMEYAVSRGADREALARQSGIALQDVEDGDARLPLTKYVALMKAGQELANDPALALHFGEAIDLSEVSIMGLIGQAARTMKEAFDHCNRYARLVVDVDIGGAERFRLERNAGDLWLIDTRNDPNAFPELTEASFARAVSGNRRWFDRQFVKAVRFTHRAPTYRAEFDRIFRVPVTFGCEKNAMLLDETWFSEPIARQPRYAFGILMAHADALLESLDASTTVKGCVERALMPILHTGGASMGEIARQLGFSRKTLYRRLKDEGTTFEKVLEGLRHKLTLEYLGARKVSVNETAFLVGFSDVAAFSRAFKRWTGTNPRTLRGRPAAETCTHLSPTPRTRCKVK